MKTNFIHPNELAYGPSGIQQKELIVNIFVKDPAAKTIKKPMTLLMTSRPSTHISLMRLPKVVITYMSK